MTPTIHNPDIAISVRNLSKKYRLYETTKHRFKEALHPFRKKYHREFWSLKNVSFDVKRGETVGIIGQNGSGKSTLLQIICGTMAPTQGDVKLNGRVSALLELGAGFNPEFTGRENVYLNGSIMGMSRETIDDRFEDIASFADIGYFIDQPVKTYSSGMYVRLAFACAINVDPDILVIDEALSVGDAKFQHKCFNKFIEFQEAGKAILFVSHSTDAIVKHCEYAVLLDKGNVVEIGNPKFVTNYYLDLLFTGQVTGYTKTPILVEEGYNEFNIIHYGKKYYAILKSLGFVDFDRPNEDIFKEYMAENKCMVGQSPDEVKQLIDQIVTAKVNSSNQNMELHFVKDEKTELDKFLEDVPTTDKCIHRKNYNKDEHRYGDKRAEIVDFLLFSNGQYEPPIVKNCGDLIDIYVKIKVNENIEKMICGIKIKTVDGVEVFGTDTRHSELILKEAIKSNFIIYKFSIKMSLAGGHYFLNVGIAEVKGSHSEDIHIDRRLDLIHIIVQASDWFVGFVGLEYSINECKQ